MSKGLMTSLVAARIPQSILGALTPIIFYLLCREMTSERVAILAALLLAFEPIHIGLSSMAHLDATLAFHCVLTTYTFWKGLEDDRWMFLSGLSFGLALLTKAPAIFLFLTSYVTLLIVFLVSDHKVNRFGCLSTTKLLWPLIGWLPETNNSRVSA